MLNAERLGSRAGSMLNAYRCDTTVQEGWWIVHDPVPKQQWEVRVAGKKEWQVRMAYYDRLLRSLMEMIEATVKNMKADEMSDEVEDLG